MPLFLLLGVFAMIFSSEAEAQHPKPKPPPPLPPGGSPLAGGYKLLEGLHPDAVAFVLEVARRAKAEGIGMKLISGKRTCAQQNALYAQGRTAAGPIVTGARGCQSWHTQGRAVDFLPSPTTEAAYARVGAIAQELGGVWGGKFSNLRDLGHIEYHPGLKISDVCPDPEKCLDPRMATNTQGPAGYLLPAKALPYGAIFYAYQGYNQGYGQGAYSQFNNPGERDLFLAGCRGMVALIQGSGTLEKPSRPIDFYVVLLDNGKPIKQGLLSDLLGCPWPPFVWGGQGVGMRPNLTAAGYDPVPGLAKDFPQQGEYYISPLMGQAWGAWTKVGPAPLETFLGRIFECQKACRSALKAAGVKQVAEGMLIYRQDGTPDPALSWLRAIAL